MVSCKTDCPDSKLRFALDITKLRISSALRVFSGGGDLTF